MVERGALVIDLERFLESKNLPVVSFLVSLLVFIKKLVPLMA